MDAWYASKFQDLSSASTKHAQSVRTLREEMAGYRKNVSAIFSIFKYSLCGFLLQCLSHVCADS